MVIRRDFITFVEAINRVRERHRSYARRIESKIEQIRRRRRLNALEEKRSVSNVGYGSRGKRSRKR